jgi:hypothetical protein
MNCPIAATYENRVASAGNRLLRKCHSGSWTIDDEVFCFNSRVSQGIESTANDRIPTGREPA